MQMSKQKQDKQNQQISDVKITFSYFGSQDAGKYLFDQDNEIPCTSYMISSERVFG